MPVNHGEEEAPSGIFEKVAKAEGQQESTASTHEARECPLILLSSQHIHMGTDDNEHNPGKASVQDFQSKGPAIPESIGDVPKASKEELKARAEELNK